MAHLLSNHLEGNVLSTMRAFHRFTDYPKRLGYSQQEIVQSEGFSGPYWAFLWVGSGPYTGLAFAQTAQVSREKGQGNVLVTMRAFRHFKSIILS